LPDVKAGRQIANAVALIDGGKVVAVRRKSLLPTYDVFDEWRYFEPATSVAPVPFRGRSLGISICEDIWNDGDFWPKRLYREDPVEKLVAAGADLLINIAASPFTIEKRHLRPRMLASVARHWQRPLLFVNQVGGQDDLVFDGSSLAIDATGEIYARAAEHAPDLLIVDPIPAAGRCGRSLPRTRARRSMRWCSAPATMLVAAVSRAHSSGFRAASIRRSWRASPAGRSARKTCSAWPCRRAIHRITRGATPPTWLATWASSFARSPSSPCLPPISMQLAPAFAGREPDVTEENLQARVRGGLLMALSNKFGKLLLSTGNKSEIATGYCTLYGDTNGGLAVISDVPKTLVYKIAREINADGPVIPESTLTKPPSAELRPDQVDQDSLPPYDVLDAILAAHIEDGLDSNALLEKGFERTVVDKVLRLVRTSEYKRRQLPPGLKITGKAFGTGRRYPIAQAFRG
jgi:NAD+ synthase (glutamine-hydrolysing)